MKRFTNLFCLLSVLGLISCSHQQEMDDGKRTNELYVVSWNVQTFFDAETSGLEYSEFRGSKSKWNRELYETRLDRLAEAIELLDADILVLQEIENIAVMYDISNRLTGRLRGSDAYGWMSFAAEEDASIGCGVFSRLPLGQKRIHQVDCRTRGEQPQLRPLLEVEVLVDSDGGGEGVGGERASTVNLFVCHWKSKSGGEEEAIFWQEKQESLLEIQLQRVLSEVSGTSGSGRAIICGDFNRDLEEFRFSAGENQQLFLGSVEATNGWLHPNTSSAGSYVYKEEWQKIDHVFVAGDLKIHSFEALTSGPWVQVTDDGQKLPFRYAMWRDAGYSDHLPVGAWVGL